MDNLINNYKNDTLLYKKFNQYTKFDLISKLFMLFHLDSNIMLKNIIYIVTY